MRNVLRSVLAVAVLAVSLATAAYAAAAIDGKWVATVQGPEGAAQVTLDLKAEGDKLGGTFSFGAMPGAPISNGKVTAEEVSFDVVLGDGAFTLPFKGKLEGEKLNLTIVTPNGDQPVAFTRAPAS